MTSSRDSSRSLSASLIEFALLLYRRQPGVCRVQFGRQDFDARPTDKMGLLDENLDRVTDGLVEFGLAFGGVRAI